MKEIDHIFTPYVHEKNILSRYRFPHLKWANGAGRVWAGIDRGAGRSPHRPAAMHPPTPPPSLHHCYWIWLNLSQWTGLVGFCQRGN